MLGTQNEVDLTPSQRKEILDLLDRYLPDTEVWLYGSRVKKASKPHSDLDMVVFAEPEQRLQVFRLQEAFEESYLPFRIDLFVWDDVPEKFRENIKSDHVVFR